MPNFHIRAYIVHITNLTEQEIRLSEEFRFSHQGSTVEVTVAPQLNQGVCTHVLSYHACLNFLVLFLSREKVQRNLVTQWTKK